jgi:OOP family OmpA-OmpF porin
MRFTKSSIAITLSVLLSCFLHFNSLLAQNLLPNPGFENYKYCPTKVGQFSLVKDWMSGNTGTPDYYNECSYVNNMRFPRGLGSIPPHSGDGYAGIITLDKYSDIAEYIQTTITDSLVKGKTYTFKMYVALAEDCKYAMSEIGIYFSNKYIHNARWERLELKPQVNNPTENIIANTDWTLIEGKYKAKGGEKYITIGNFGSGNTYHKKLLSNSPFSEDIYSYYYIDDVSLVEDKALSASAKMRAETEINSPFGKLKLGTVVAFKSVLFDFNKTALLSKSKIELNRIYYLLTKYPKLEIEIRGHTDNKGSEAYNITLSSKRAKAIVDFLLAKGIAANRLSAIGFGNTMPLSDNLSEKGRQNNRRVEFKIVKM